MDLYEVKPIFYKRTEPFELEIDVPGSKSITNRALMMAALADGMSVLKGVLFSDDSRHFIKCLQKLGFPVKVEEEVCKVSIRGFGGKIPKQEANIYVGSAGTAARFLTAMLGFAAGTWHLDASEQMRRRPMKPLIETLRTLGCEIICEEKEGFFPFTIRSEGISLTEASVDIGDSSQFLSALLMAGVMLDHDFTIHISGTHGFSYIEMTMMLMKQFGAEVSSVDKKTYVIRAGSAYHSRVYQIEPDVSAAAYFYGMAAISGGRVLVNNVHSDSLQGDIKVIRAFEKMGCTAEETPKGIALKGPENGILRGIDLDMRSFSDQALTIAAIAPFAESNVRIRSVGHIRLQESDRMTAIVTNLRRIGVKAEIDGNDIFIYPSGGGCSSELHGARISTYEDHRVAMAFALTGMRQPGIIIEDPMCCRKTFENYFEILDRICESKTQKNGTCLRPRLHKV